MAFLPVRRGAVGGGAGAGAEVDPFTMVRDSMRRMQNLFREPLFDIEPVGYLEAGASYAPDFEVRETRDGLVFTADVPGVKEDDLEITVVGNRLRINGKREFQQENRGDTWYTAERPYGNFTRSFILPEGCDTNNINANVENGVLTICLGKRAESQPRRILLGGQQPKIEGKYGAQAPSTQAQTSSYGPNYPAGGTVPQAQGPGYGSARPEAGWTGERPQAGDERTYGEQGGPVSAPGKIDKE